jgi:hypothetical protein
MISPQASQIGRKERKPARVIIMRMKITYWEEGGAQPSQPERQARERAPVAKQAS